MSRDFTAFPKEKMGILYNDQSMYLNHSSSSL